MNNEFKDYYKILGITPRATLENIQNAARREMSQNWNNAIGRLNVQEAYDVLSNPDRKKEYDEEFNRRINERERALRNARTFEEYIAATSLHSELSNVDIAPELTTPQEVEMAEEERVEQEKIKELREEKEKQIDSSKEKEQEESTIDLSVGSDSSESTSEDAEYPQETEEEQVEEEVQEEEKTEEEQVEEKVQEEEKTEEEQVEEKVQEEEKTEEEQVEEEVQEEGKTEEEQVEEEVQEEGKTEEEVREFINIPIQRLEKEVVQSNESVKIEKEEIKEEPIISSSAKKTIGRSLIIGGGIALGYLVIGGIPGATIGFIVGVASGDFYKKHAGKIKLQKEPKELKVTEIETEETKLIEESNRQLEDQIYELLSRPNNNYELEIAIIKYQNTKKLLEKRIEFKKSERSKKEKTLKEMEIEALEKKLVKATKKLEKLNAMVAKSKESRLNKLNNEISQKKHEIIEIQGDKDETKLSSEETSKIDNLVVRQSRLLNKRDKRANKMVLYRNWIARGQVVLATGQSIKNTFKELLQPFDEEVEENVDTPKSL